MRQERFQVVHPSGGPVLVKRSEQDLTDVNLIMDSWIHAGSAVAGHMNPGEGRYGDFSSGLDYHSALNAVKEAEGQFMTLPPRIRSHVDNDPGKLLDLYFDPERREERERIGLVPPSVPDAAPGGSAAGSVKVPASGAEKAGAEGTAAGSVPPDPAAELFD